VGKKAKKEKVSLYIPCFNAANHIKFCVEAVLRQNYPIDEVLIIDDASTDKVQEILAKMPVRIIRHPVNRGLASVRNTALKNAKGDFLASLDADCVPEQDWLERLMQHFSSNKVAGIGGKVLESYKGSAMDLWRSVHMKQEWGSARTSSVSFLFGSNNVFRKSTLKKVDGYDETYINNYEDVDISGKIKKAGYKLVYEPEALVHHLKKDNFFSVLNTFWNWNFAYHEKEGYYKDREGICRKAKENIGLANRFLEKDFKDKNFQLIYINFLLPIYLSLKDLFFIYNREIPIEGKLNKPLPILYLSLLDLTLFYHLDRNKKSLNTVISYKGKFFQNFLVFLILAGKIIMSRVNDSNFLKEYLRYFFGAFTKEKGKPLEFLLDKSLSLLELHRDWSGFLDKKHPNLEQKMLKVFLKHFEEWLDNLVGRIPDIFNLIQLSQHALIKEEVYS
jgi:cellulose synthase/poly-beta-1,6-N-acetylglucosamine synthase-like glycosyltransferase